MEYLIRNDCPHCSAPIEISEAIYLTKCKFCKTNIIVARSNPPVYTLGRFTFDKHLLIPYWRLKGLGFDIFKTQTSGYLFDINVIAIDEQLFHALVAIEERFYHKSLGIRAQTQPLSFLKPLKNAQLLTPIPFNTITIKKYPKHKKPLHTVFIGESKHLIYLILGIQDSYLIETLTNKKIGQYIELSEKYFTTPNQKIAKPLYSLCPKCGDLLHGYSNSLFFICYNCTTGWYINNGLLTEKNFIILETKNENVLYMPFWLIEEFKPSAIFHFLQDIFHSLTFVKKNKQEKLKLLIPAFITPPNNFIKTIQSVTLANPTQRKVKEDISEDITQYLFPVKVPEEESKDAITLLLLEFSRRGKAIEIPKKIEIFKSSLIFIPFEKKRYRYFLSGTMISLVSKFIDIHLKSKIF